MAWLARGRRVGVMGVVNITPDSFLAASRASAVDAAVAAALEQAAAGADVVDLGGESTRPGATPITAAEERERVLPVLEALRGRISVPLSIDTYKAEVARLAVAAGASIVNDVSGGLLDPDMPASVAALGVPVIVGHLRGTPASMLEHARYADPVAEVREEVAERLACFRSAGVVEGRLWADPGIGFAKRAGDSLTLLANLGAFRALGVPIVVGLSRKSFLGETLRRAGIAPTGPEERLEASLGAAVLAAERGAAVIRTHDVLATRRALSVVEAILDG